MTEKWILRTTDLKQTDLSLPISVPQKNQLVFSSLKKLGFFWLLAVFSVAIPVLHFVLVPTFLIIGFVMFFSQMKNTHYLKEGSAKCPACEKEIHFKNFFFQNGQRFQCKHCHQQLVIEISRS